MQLNSPTRIALSTSFFWFLLCASPTLSIAQSLNNLEEIKIWLDGRYRYERVNQKGFVAPARASTLRLRPGLEYSFSPGFRIGVEGDFVAEVGPDEFNNTINGKIQFPLVVDVESAELNQAYIEVSELPGLVLRAGRYRLDLDNWRFIGSVLWRQNDQTFDGATATLTAIPGLEVLYGYIGNVNRIFSDDGPDGAINDGNLTSNVHFVHPTIKELPMRLGSVTGYAYLMEFMDGLDALSNASLGGFWKGDRKLFGGVNLNYYLEYAFQKDYADHPLNYEAHYLHLAPGLSFHGLTVTLGYELLGTDDGVFAFQTPLATGHKFNGFADVFLLTPAAGLKDYYVDVTYKLDGLPSSLNFLNGLLIQGQYHEFQSDQGSIDYGQEFDLYVKKPIGHGLYLDFKYANYKAEQFATDREKIIFGINYKY